MSTKTTFKRIALVAVASLGFGVLTSIAPASANTITTNGASASFGLNATSITLVDDAASATIIPADAVFGAFEVSVTNKSGFGNVLQTGESLTATVIGNPNTGVVASTANAYINLSWASTWTPQTGAATSADYGVSKSIGTADSAYAKDTNLAASKRGGTATSTNYTLKAQEDSTTTALLDGGAAKATYALMVAAKDAAALNAGFYTIRIDLLDVNKNAIQSSTVRFQVVTSKIGAGTAQITVTGPQAKGGALAATSTSRITATLRDPNGGLVRTGANAAPVLSGTITDADTTPLVEQLTWADSASSATVETSILDGNYLASLTDGSLTVIAGTSTARVIFGNSATTSDLFVTGFTSSQGVKTSVTATGRVNTTGSTTNFDLPLTTKSASVKATVFTDASTSTTTVADAVLYYTLAYDTAKCVAGDMLPTAKTVPTKLVADANGVVSIDITNANPLDGCKATVTFTNGTAYAGSTNSLTRELTWAKPVPTSVTVSPTGNYKALLKSSHKVTWTILDQFSAPVSGSTVTFTATGANTPTAGVPSVISDVNGQVSYSWTDAKGVVDSTTLGYDAIELKAVGTTAFAQGKRQVDYVATLPAIASLYATYEGRVAAVSVIGTVPTTNIGGTTGIAVSKADQINTGLPIATPTFATGSPWVKLNFQARAAAAVVGTTGVPTTITATGAMILDGGKLVSSVTAYANDDIWVLGTKTGVATVTATNGTVTSTAKINFVNADTDARVLSLTQGNGLVTATVVDAFGNAVSGVTVDATGTGGAWFGNGATSASFKTATDGTVTFAITGAGTVTASLGSTYTKAAFLAGFGDATGTLVITGAPAGVAEASIVTTNEAAVAAAKAAADKAAADKASTDAAIAALKAQLDAAAAKAAADKASSDAAIAAAQAAAVEAATAAADAAAEATDAANAATDAANASAEAGDAATAAAQDAADAVAALSTQVSEMIDTLKKQITALTNLVIKIQKKVKA